MNQLTSKPIEDSPALGNVGGTAVELIETEKRPDRDCGPIEAGLITLEGDRKSMVPPTDPPATAIGTGDPARAVWQAMAELQSRIAVMNADRISNQHPAITVDIIERLWKFGREHADSDGLLPDIPTIDDEICRAVGWYREPSWMSESLMQADLLGFDEDCRNYLCGWSDRS